ncbi:MAG: ribose-5-phosphate isomerase RpiA [Fibrobacterales bacterium]
MTISELKKEAGYTAANLIQNNMRVGLGTGSTAYFAIERLAARIKDENLTIQAVSTSFDTTAHCIRFGIPLLDVSQVDSLDLTIDGADEIDPAKNLIKGRGAAHTQEKIVEAMSKEFIVVADETKEVSQLGTKMPVPVEVMPIALASAMASLSKLGATCTIRLAGTSKDGPVISDNGNLIIDAEFDAIENPKGLETAINMIPGVLDNGIFSGYATQVILATSDGLKQF